MKNVRKLLTVMHTRWILFRESLRNVGDIVRLFWGTRPPSSSEKSLIVSIRDFRHGRYGYLLVSYFAQAGYRIYFYRSLSFLTGLYGYDRAVFQLSGVGIFRRSLFSEAESVDFLGLNARLFQPSGLRIGKRFFIDLDYFNPTLLSDVLRIPYHIHPLMQRHPFKPEPGRLRHRILMYGQPDLEWSPELIRDHFGLLPRSEVFSHLSSGTFEWVRPADHSALERFLAQPIDRPMACLIDSRTCWIPAAQWLKVLSAFDFFVATPGVSMPHSHNMIEAMSVGTIPVTQYGQHLHPPLADRLDCVVFSDLIDLEKILEELMMMDSEEIVQMRSGVNDYFSQHIDPQHVVDQWLNLEARELHLFFNAEEASLALLRNRLGITPSPENAY
jgi:hypothetical protein